MAGDWIKMRSDLFTAPQFDRLRCELQTSPAEVLVLLYRLAGWFEKHGDYGHMKADDAQAIDDFLQRPGFSEHLKGCGWLKESGGMVWLTGFCVPSASRKSLGAKVRADVLSAQRCAACSSIEDLVVDHIVPVVRGGSSERANLQCLCSSCNRAKGRMTMTEFMTGRRRGT